MLFTYLGPKEEQPAFIEWDLFHRKDGSYRIEVQDDYECNWLQIQENAADVTHTSFLHAKYFEALGHADSTGFNLPMLKYGFQPFQFGIIKSWCYEGEKSGWGNLLVFPNMLRLMSEMHWRVAIDNYTTRILWLTFLPGENSDRCDPGDVKVMRQPARMGEGGGYHMKSFMSQDAMAVETQGRIFDRSCEKLGASDMGIVMFRRMLLEQIEKVKAGGRPIANVYSDAESSEVTDLRSWMGGYIPMSCLPDPTFRQTRSEEETFDERHSEYWLPVASQETLRKKYKLFVGA